MIWSTLIKIFTCTFAYSHFETKVLHLKFVPPRLTGYFFLSVNNKYLATSDVCKKNINNNKKNNSKHSIHGKIMWPKSNAHNGENKRERE